MNVRVHTNLYILCAVVSIASGMMIHVNAFKKKKLSQFVTNKAVIPKDE